MKLICILLALYSFALSDEMQRIEAIIDDITKLRVDYEACKKDLNKLNPHAASNGVTIVHEAQSCEKFTQKIQENKNTLAQKEQEISILKEKNKDLKNQIFTSKKLLISKENELKNFESKMILNGFQENNKLELIEDKYKKLLKIKEDRIYYLQNRLNVKKVIKNQICKDDNVFPKLLLKDKHNKAVQVNVIKDEINIIENKMEIITSIKASTYRLKRNSDIYDDVDGNKIDTWEKSRSFTSTKKSQNWVQISGYFEDRKWKKSSQELWIQLQNVSQR